MSERGRIIPVLLSGGSGTRLWPLSTPERPKQMLPLLGAETLLRSTARRVRDPELFAPPVIVAAEAHAEAVEAEVEALSALILEPAPRNTAPAIALAALAGDPGDLLLVLPSDHAVADEAAFIEAVRKGMRPAREGWLVTFGIRPDRPETGYGYIRRGAEIEPGVHRSEGFVEKPDAETAREYLSGGAHDWNGGIFLFEAGVLLDALGRHAPDMLAAAQRSMAQARRTAKRIMPDPAAFRASPAQSVDYAVMEKAERIAVVPVSMGWSDVGSWDALWEMSARNADGNALDGQALAIDSRGCLIRSDGPRVAAIGVSDLIVVATQEAVLVLPRGLSQRVREAVEKLPKGK